MYHKKVHKFLCMTIENLLRNLAKGSRKKGQRKKSNGISKAVRDFDDMCDRSPDSGRSHSNWRAYEATQALQAIA